jgi:DNA-binding HxlR family transcriptional regulator
MGTTNQNEPRPIMQLLDLLGKRWTLRIIWELRGAGLRFRTLQAACGGISPSVMQTRLRDLRNAGLVELDPAEGYVMTELGRSFVAAFEPLYRFADQWSKQLAD